MKKYLLLPATLFLVNSIIAQTTGNTPKAIRLIDKQLTLSGMFSDETAQSFIGLEAGDKIILNCYRLSKKGSASISVKDYNRENELKDYGLETHRLLRMAKAIHKLAKAN